MKLWGDSDQGMTAFMRLTQFLFLATGHRVGIVTVERMGKFQKAMHSLLLISLLFGVIKRGGISCHKRGEEFLLSFLVIFFLILLGYGTIRFLIGTRDIIAPVILYLAWTGNCAFELEYRMRRANWLTKSNHNSRAGFMNMRWILLILVVLALLPKPLAPQRAEKIPIKEAGIWTKEHGARNPMVMTKGRLARIAFYADGPFLEVPKDQDLFEYARKNRVDFLAIKSESRIL